MNLARSYISMKPLTRSANHNLSTIYRYHFSHSYLTCRHSTCGIIKNSYNEQIREHIWIHNQTAALFTSIKNDIPTSNLVRRFSSDAKVDPVSDLSSDKSDEVKKETIPIGLMKNESDPEILPDSEYPSWLFEVLDEIDPRKRKTEITEGMTWSSGAKAILKRKNTRAIKRANSRQDKF